MLAKTISKFRVSQKLQFVCELVGDHVVLGQKNPSIGWRFFVVPSNFEQILKARSSVDVEAEIQQNRATGEFEVIGDMPTALSRQATARISTISSPLSFA